ncbi:MAG: hypothetical protein Q4G67_00975 [Actinomycetia bacterium]|nr:hypothetical protein [Actinomycetes bacterium]
MSSYPTDPQSNEGHEPTDPTADAPSSDAAYVDPQPEEVTQDQPAEPEFQAPYPQQPAADPQQGYAQPQGQWDQQQGYPQQHSGQWVQQGQPQQQGQWSHQQQGYQGYQQPGNPQPAQWEQQGYQPAAAGAGGSALGLEGLSPQKKNLWFAGMGAAAVMLITTFMPWASVGPISVSGISGDGMFVFVFAIIAAAALAAHVFATGEWTKWMPWVAIGAAALSLLIMLVSMVNISSTDTGIWSASMGFGLILGFIAAIALGVVSFLYQKD